MDAVVISVPHFKSGSGKSWNLLVTSWFIVPFVSLTSSAVINIVARCGFPSVPFEFAAPIDSKGAAFNIAFPGCTEVQLAGISATNPRGGIT